MSHNFKTAAQARGQMFQAATGLVSNITGRGGGGFPPLDNFPPTGGGNFQNDFNDDPRPQPRGLFGPRPLIRGVPDIITVGGAAIPTNRCEAGMLVYVRSERNIYMLDHDLVTWLEYGKVVADLIEPYL